MKTLVSAKSSLARSRSRKNARGVSMVEGALILPILSIFFGLLQFVHAEYDTKMLTMWDAHNQAWAYASHGCVDGEGVVEGQPNEQANGAQSAIGGLPQDPVQQKATDTLLERAAGPVLPGIVEKDATGNAKWSKYQRTITSRSWVYCNEQNNNGSLGILTEFYEVGHQFINVITKSRHR